jgi:TRAP-type C4-dicarboxylate transport system permease small subunit
VAIWSKQYRTEALRLRVQVAIPQAARQQALRGKTGMLDSILQRVSKLSQVMVWIGGALLIFAALMTTIDVFARKFFGWTFGGADEIAGYMFAISTAFAMSMALLHRTHVRIDALYLVLPARVRTVLDIVAFVMMASFLAFIAERAFSVWWNSYESSSVSITPLVTPLALPQGFWFAGFAFAMLVVLLMTLRIIVAVYQRDWRRISQLVGARGLNEEVEDERLAAQK